MIVLNIDDEIKSLAIKHSDERIQYEFNRFSFNLDKRKNMILIGTIGQLIFKKYLEENKINYYYQFQAGQYDNFDFEIAGKKYEIKTSGYNDSFLKLNLLYSHDQYIAGENKGFSYCVQIFINGKDINTGMVDIDKVSEATIAGYIEFDKIVNYKKGREYYGDDYRVPISHLKDVRALLKPTN